MLIWKDVWDLISTGPRPQRRNPGLWGKEIKEDHMAVGTAQQFIREGISDQITFNIMHLENPKEMWDKLKSICTKIGQEVVYSIFPELLHYPKINKPKGYEKPIMQIFAAVKYLCKHLRTTMTPGRNLWDTIAIVIALDSLHKDFDTITASLLETGNKTIDQIQSILQSKVTKNLSKRVTRGTGNQAMAFRDKEKPKRKANSDDKCYNCHKFGHFGRDHALLDRRLNRTTTLTQQSWREESRREDSRRERSGIRSRTPNRAHQAAKNNKSLKHDNDSNLESFPPGPVGNAFMVKEQGLQKLGTNNTWFLDSCASRHMCNDQTLSSDLKAKSIDFVTVAGQVIRTEEISTVTISLADGNIELHNVAGSPECDLNRISLGQL